MNEEVLTVCHNVMALTSLQAFANVKGRLKQGQKDVFFIRCIGYDENYANEIAKMDQLFLQRIKGGQKHYMRIFQLPKQLVPAEAAFYTKVYEEWVKSGEKIAVTKVAADKETGKLLADALKKMGEIFRKLSPHSNPSIVKNFLIKVLYWLDQTTADFFLHWTEGESYKYVFCGAAKIQEYLFLYFLTLMGIDVLILSPEGELDLTADLLQLSHKLALPYRGKITIPVWNKAEENTINLAPEKPIPAANTTKLTPEKPASAAKMTISAQAKAARQQELTYEELARLAKSVVMINVHNQEGKVVGGGSGIMINRGGYILTNHHVACRGVAYSVRIEDEKEIYPTDVLIKYNQVLDLALLRIEKELTPIPIYSGEKELVRGQQVIAIGSPLGLFNSVSDGIISGFRRFDDVNMIQFTAPISNGSSGGALLNMYGEVIGISSAGFDKGQNINLAVDYQDIKQFLQGFI